MPAPSVDPAHLDPAAIPPVDSYRPKDPVWVYRTGAWRAGVIVSASSTAATVTYRPGDALGTAVDTLTALYLLPRIDTDPILDGPTTGLIRRTT